MAMSAAATLREQVRRGPDGAWTAIQDMSVDHGRRHVTMTEQFLDCPDVVPVLQQVGGERVAEGVAPCGLRDARRAYSVADGALEDGFVEMMAPVLPGLVITVQPGGGEHPLPRPLPSRVRVLPAEAAWQLDPAGAAGDVALVKTSHALEVAPQRLPDNPGEDRDPVLVALAGPDDDVACLEVDVLHAKPGALEQPQAGAVE